MPCSKCSATLVALAVCYYCEDSVCVEKCLMWKKTEDGVYHHCCKSCKGIKIPVTIPVAVSIKRRNLNEKIRQIELE